MALDFLKGLVRRIARPSAAGGAFGPLLPEDQAYREAARAHIRAILDETPADRYCWDPTKLASFPALHGAPPEVRSAFVLLAMEQMFDLDEVLSARRYVTTAQDEYRDHTRLRALVPILLRGNLPFKEEEIQFMVQTCASRKAWVRDAPIGSVIGAVERLTKAQASLTDGLLNDLSILRQRLPHTVSSNRELRLLKRRIDMVLGKPAKLDVDRSEPWARLLLDGIATMSEAKRSAWQALLAHASTAIQSKPSKAWLAAAGPWVEMIDAEDFRSLFLESVVMVGRQAEGFVANWQRPDPTLLSDANSDILRGLVWCCVLVEEPAVVRGLGDLGQVCFAKVPNFGPRNPKVGNACVQALSRMNGTEAIAQLSRLRVKVKHNAARATVEKGLAATAERAGITPDELEEISVPEFGMTEAGLRRTSMGNYVAESRVTGSDKVEITWVHSGGRRQKSVPTEVKEAHADALKEFKRSIKDLQQILPAQRDRIERLLLADRTWEFETWRSRYLDHPLISTLARRLIWQVETNADTALAGWLDGELVGAEDRPLAKPAKDRRVRLWHPISSPAETVLAWRNWLERHQIVQPFKQAHREVYLLTDAEERTETYSNRFAAHIVRQHQLAALCGQRGWRYRLQGNFDSANYPELVLPRWRVRAEYFVESNVAETSPAGIFLYVSTDQVRFYAADERGQPMRLRDVPPLVFSEVMRDVDLFVGVAGVGNDATWADGEPEGRYRDYWERTSFGELAESAKTRREVIERLLPRLAIAQRCSLTDRFLVVRGNLRTYKVHLGSGNILMSPNAQYLCIVPGSARQAPKSGNVYLPFEGDRTLSIILSKAFMLAEDTKIKDPSITRQIKGN